MSKKAKALSPSGAKTAAEMFGLVGQAISWWEQAEDSILGLFRALCADAEPVAMEAFVQAPRKVRDSMLRLAMETYAYRFEGDEIAKVQTALKRMDKLAITRNEIAHGRVVQYHEESGGHVVADGNYLLPSTNEKGPMIREHRFHHTPDTLLPFIADVRRTNAHIQDVYMAVMVRSQELLQQPAFEGWGVGLVDVSRRLGRFELKASDAVELLRRIMRRMDEAAAKRAGSLTDGSP